MSMAAPGRFIEIDLIRGIAIILVIVFHFFFDLAYLGIVHLNLADMGWILFQRTAATLFILIAGIGLVLSENRNNEGYVHHARRGIFLAAIALLITVVTWVYPHDGFIIFGIIHFLALCAFVGPFFLKYERILPLLAALTAVAGFSLWQLDSPYLLWLGFTYPGFHTFDYFPVLPWFGVFLTGAYIGIRLYRNNIRAYELKLNEKNALVRSLSWLGRHTLIIYLIHQPLIFAILFLFMIN